MLRLARPAPAAAAATRRRWDAAARASRSCWAAEAKRRRWAGAARASRSSAVSSGPLITRAKPPIAATTRTRAIPMANISYNNIGSPPPFIVGTKPLAYFLKFRFQRENAKRSWGHLLKSEGMPRAPPIPRRA